MFGIADVLDVIVTLVREAVVVVAEDADSRRRLRSAVALGTIRGYHYQYTKSIGYIKFIKRRIFWINVLHEYI